MNKSNLSWYSDRDVHMVIDILQQSKVVVGTTDTIIGLLAVINPETYNRLQAIKQREDKPFLILASSVASVQQWVTLPGSLAIKRIMDTFWPGPLTLIFRAQPHTPWYVTGGRNTIAVRIPDHAGLQQVIAHTGPLFSTSANLTGQAVPSTIAHISEGVMAQVAGCINSGTGTIVASTIIDVSGETPRLVRQGAIPFEDIKKSFVDS